MKRYSMNFDSLWGTVKPSEDSCGAWVRVQDIKDKGKEMADEIKALKADLKSARHQLQHQNEELKKYRGDS